MYLLIKNSALRIFFPRHICSSLTTFFNDIFGKGECNVGGRVRPIASRIPINNSSCIICYQPGHFVNHVPGNITGGLTAASPRASRMVF